MGVFERAGMNRPTFGGHDQVDLGQKAEKAGREFYATLNSKNSCLKIIDKFRNEL